ncbi:MAG: hypothetical protein OEM29_09160, partial [Thermoplasmata archaeon]|nr:hypothetical protein [Thermoplasmata archaeon]
MQEGQGNPPKRKGLESTTVAIIVIAVVAVVLVGSVGTYLLFRQVLDEIDDNGHYEYTESVEYEYPADSYTALDVSNV